MPSSREALKKEGNSVLQAVSTGTLLLICVLLNYASSVVAGFYSSGLLATPVFFWVDDIIRFVCLPLLMLWLLLKKRRIIPGDYGIQGPGPALSTAGLLSATITAILLLQLYFPIGAWARKIFPPDHVSTYVKVLPSGPLFGVVVIYFSLTAGFFQEIFYRGMMYSAMLRIVRLETLSLLYVTFSSVLFATMHWANGTAAMIAAFASGLISSVLFLIFRNLWPLIIAHAIVDLQVGLEYL